MHILLLELYYYSNNEAGQTSVRLTAADLADLCSALDPAMCRGMYQSIK